MRDNDIADVIQVLLGHMNEPDAAFQAMIKKAGIESIHVRPKRCSTRIDRKMRRNGEPGLDGATNDYGAVSLVEIALVELAVEIVEEAGPQRHELGAARRGFPLQSQAGEDQSLTWQLRATLDYRFDQNWSASIGYRHLAVDYRRDGFIYDTSLSGPIVGVSYRF